MSDTLGIINYQFLSQEGQPLANLNIAILSGDLSSVTVTEQPGSPLATLYADPAGATPITNPTTIGVSTVTTDGYGNLASLVNGVYTVGVCVATSSEYVVLQVYGAGVTGQQLIQVFVPHP